MWLIDAYINYKKEVQVLKFVSIVDGPKMKPRLQRPWRRQLKSSQSDSDSSYSPRTSAEGDSCSCDNGFVLVDEAFATRYIKN